MERLALGGRFLLPVIAVAMTGGALGQSIRMDPASLSLTTGSAEVRVLLQSPDPVEGFVAAILVPTELEVTDLGFSGAAAAVNGGAGPEDPSLAQVFGGQLVVFAAIVDTNGVGQSDFDASSEVEVGRFTVLVRSPRIDPDPAITVSIAFEDGSPLHDPPLDNIIVTGGGSTGVNEGLTLGDDVPVTLNPVSPDQLRIECEGVEIRRGEPGPVRVLLSNIQDVQAFVVAIQHDATVLDLVDIQLGTATLTNGTSIGVNGPGGSEFVGSGIFPDGGFLGVVLDADPPFDDQKIPAGTDNHIGSFVYDCVVEIGAQDPAVPGALELVDGVIGNPVLDNIVVVGGQSRNPTKIDSPCSILCVPPPAGCTPPPIEFLMGAELNPEEINLLDGEEGECNTSKIVPPPVESVTPGETAEVCLFYHSPEKLVGLSMAICYDCRLQAVDFRVAAIAETLEAEFVNVDLADNTTDFDGDPECEIVVGLLIDATPPFDDRRLPATRIVIDNDGNGLINPEQGDFVVEGPPQEVVCIDFLVTADACDPDGPVELDVAYCDQANGSTRVPIENIAVAECPVEDAPPDDPVTCPKFPRRTGTQIKVKAEPTFIRADCNADGRLDISDSSAILWAAYLGLFIPPCEDACDVNDDGMLDLTDTIWSLAFLFRDGPKPLPPFDDLGNGTQVVGSLQAGPDDTPDGLECRTNRVCR